ncbi:MAG TPA: type 4a pilus biogenesis protein PilO [Terriglobales bacterium]|nr:type 4a pilus biogenesis protein PilO [Terriglobales bacterium]
MAKFSEMPAMTQLGIVFGLLVALSAAAWFLVYQKQADANKLAADQLKLKQDENARLRKIELEMPDLQRQVEGKKEQLEAMKKILPDEKLADQFIHLMQETAANAGIEVRRYTARQMSPQKFYTEAPYEMELDGPYYSMLDFFARVGKLERIINVNGLKVAALTRAGDSGARRRYAYAPNESVAATCVTTTFFSREDLAKPGAPPAPAAAKK